MQKARGAVGASFVDARNSVSPVGAVARDHDGTIALFDGWTRRDPRVIGA